MNVQTRPQGVTLIALWQFSKAVILVLAGTVGLPYLAATSRPNHLLVSIVYIAAHGQWLPAFLLPITAIIPAALGWGIYQLKPWARFALLISSGVTATRWISGLLFSVWALGEKILPSAAARDTVAVLVIVDLIIFSYLINSDVKRAFGDVDFDPRTDL